MDREVLIKHFGLLLYRCCWGFLIFFHSFNAQKLHTGLGHFRARSSYDEEDEIDANDLDFCLVESGSNRHKINI